MSKETISFRIEAGKRAAVDALAAALDRDRSAVINDAIEAYLELHQWQVEHIQRALAEAGAASKVCRTTRFSTGRRPRSMIAEIVRLMDDRLASPSRARSPSISSTSSSSTIRARPGICAIGSSARSDSCAITPTWVGRAGSPGRAS